MWRAERGYCICTTDSLPRTLDKELLEEDKQLKEKGAKVIPNESSPCASGSARGGPRGHWPGKRGHRQQRPLRERPRRPVQRGGGAGRQAPLAGLAHVAECFPRVIWPDLSK